MDEMSNCILLLAEEAKQKGYPSVKDYLKTRFKNWDKEEKYLLIDELYNEFLDAVAYSKETWFDKKYNVNSTFLEFLSDCLKTIESRLEELDWKRRTEYPSFPGLYNLVSEPSSVLPGAGEKLSIEDYEFYELLLKKSKETIKEIFSKPELVDDFLKKAKILRGSLV
jgi:hypothetical protein